MPLMTTHRDDAQEHLRNVEGAREHLAQLYRIPKDDRPGHLVAAAHEDIGRELAMARIEGLLEIGAQLETLNALIATSARPLGVIR